MNWQSHFQRALVARRQAMEFLAPALRQLRARANPPRHTAPGFGTLVIGRVDRDGRSGR